MSKNLEHDLQIQRLIDGELSRPEVQQLLRTANSQPEIWRELAVAFVEDRIFASESRRFSQDEGRDLEPASSPAATPLAAGGMPGSMAKPTSAWRNTGLWLSAAAMMLCAAGLGFFAGRGQAGSQVSSETNLLANSNGGNATNQVSGTGPYMFQLLDEQGQPIPNTAVPLLFEADAQRLGYDPSRAAIPPEVQSQFRRAGLELEPEVKYIKGRFPGGRQITVPYNDLKIRSYGQ
jgi:hypothetical protein